MDRLCSSGGYFATEAAAVTPSPDRFNRTGNGSSQRTDMKQRGAVSFGRRLTETFEVILPSERSE
jgi:hypothetical protein